MFELGNVCLYIIIFIKIWLGRVLFINFDVLVFVFLKLRKCKFIVYVILYRIFVYMEFLLRLSLYVCDYFNLML